VHEFLSRFLSLDARTTICWPSAIGLPIWKKECCYNDERATEIEFAAGAAPRAYITGVWASNREREAINEEEEPTEWNTLGLEIRQPLVSVANERNAGQGNCAYLACNANVSLEYVLEKIIPRGVLKIITVQFSDPWFKKKHAKRRLLQTNLLHTIYKSMRADACMDTKLFIQTDVHNLARQMDLLCQAHHGLQRDASLQWVKYENNDNDNDDSGTSPLLNEEWLAENPREVESEREICVLNAGKPVYRAQYVARALDPVERGIWDDDILKIAQDVSLKEDSNSGNK